MASFIPVHGDQKISWEAGMDDAFRFRVFCVLLLGIHRIHVVRFGLSEEIDTEEKNDLVPLWNHEITLSAEDQEHCLNTDHVEIDAGRKTPAVRIWAELFLCTSAALLDPAAQEVNLHFPAYLNEQQISEDGRFFSDDSQAPAAGSAAGECLAMR